MSDTNTNVGIPEILASLREDLDKAQQSLSKSGDQPLLKLDSAEIELSVSISQSSDVKAKLGFNVLGINLGTSAKENEAIQNAHKVKICLKPFGSVGVAGKK